MNKLLMKMSKIAMGLLTGLVATSSLVLWCCASKPKPSDEPHPSGSDIEKALVTTLKLPTFTRVSSLSVVSSRSVEANQNLGNNVVWQARIRVTITVTTDTFTLENEESNENSEVTFVRPVKRSGESIEVFGKCVSELDGGVWQTTVELEDQPIEMLGQPLSAFGPKKVIARGSEEEQKYPTDKQNAEMQAEVKKAKVKMLEGTISGYECGHACYLTITDQKGKKHTEYCDATLCGAWWTRVGGFMPSGYKGKRVRVSVVKKIISYDVEGVEPSVMDVFTKIQFLKKNKKVVANSPLNAPGDVANPRLRLPK